MHEWLIGEAAARRIVHEDADAAVLVDTRLNEILTASVDKKVVPEFMEPLLAQVKDDKLEAVVVRARRTRDAWVQLSTVMGRGVKLRIVAGAEERVPAVQPLPRNFVLFYESELLAQLDRRSSLAPMFERAKGTYCLDDVTGSAKPLRLDS